MSIDIDWVEQTIGDNPFTDAEKGKLKEMLVETSVSCGEKIVTEGQPGGTLEFLYSGRASIEDNSRYEDGLVLAEIQSGDLFGELTFLNNKPRTADIVAVEDCVVYQLSQDNFSSLMTHSPDLAYKIMAAVIEHQRNVIMSQRVTLAPELRKMKDEGSSIPLFVKVALVVFIIGMIIAFAG